MKIREINEVKTPDLQTKSTNLNLVQLSAVSYYQKSCFLSTPCNPHPNKQKDTHTSENTSLSNVQSDPTYYTNG